MPHALARLAVAETLFSKLRTPECGIGFCSCARQSAEPTSAGQAKREEHETSSSTRNGFTLHRSANCKFEMKNRRPKSTTTKLDSTAAVAVVVATLVTCLPWVRQTASGDAPSSRPGGCERGRAELSLIVRTRVSPGCGWYDSSFTGSSPSPVYFRSRAHPW